MRINKRKLIPLQQLDELYHKQAIGVPIARLIRDNDMNISIPHLSKLLHYYGLCMANTGMESAVTIYNSLNAPWLDSTILADRVQEEPEGYKYIGRFPYGEWEKVGE